MIREICAFTQDITTLPPNVFNIFNTKTEKMEEYYEPNQLYYTFHLGDIRETDQYIRVVDLNFIHACETDIEDNLAPYGFEPIGYVYKIKPLKRWMKKYE